MREPKKRMRALAAILLLSATAEANNVSVENVALSPSGGGQAAVTFDLSWENSWRDAENFDAVWVFAKYSLDGGTRWRHATLAASGTTPAGFSPGTNTVLEIVVPSDKRGAFVQRKAAGTGDVATAGMAFVWDFAGDGVSSNSQAIVKVMGIEMVYIPEGPFYVGDTDNNRPDGNQVVLCCTYIDSPDPSKTASTGTGTAEDPYRNPAGCGRVGGVTGTFNASYPNGYKAFYMAKYEMSEGQYVDFLNMLTVEQAASRFPDLKGVHRHSIDGQLSFDALAGVFGSDAPTRACGFVLFQETWKDAVSYADWVALRPATEMEFEKAGRGQNPVVNQEFPWGITNFPSCFTSLLDAGTETERPGTPVDANANVSFCTPDGPIRVGAFATNGSSRVKSGAGYYGVMDLAGNVIDRVVSSGASTRTGAAQWPSFGGVPGDGEVSRAGLNNTAGWPPMYSSGLAGAAYTCRGSGWQGRNNAAIDRVDPQLRIRRPHPYAYQPGYGGVRAARTAP